MPNSRDELTVLHICSASRAIYGAVQSLLTLASAQKSVGKRVEFVTFAGKEFGREVSALGYPVHEVAVRAKVDPLAILAMRKVILRGGVDIVHTHLSTSSVNGCLAARLSRVPCVATVHGLSGRLSFGFADHLIGVSDEVKSHLARQGVPADRITPAHNGLPMDLPEFDRLAVRASMSLPADAIVLGTISRVTAKKGIEDALRAVARLPSVYYVLAGDGDGLEDCRRRVAELGIADRVRFLGYRKDVDTCLAAMDLFVFPSQKEAMGISLVEAMRSSLPTVAYETGGVPEVITPECGVLVPLGNWEALASAAKGLLDDRVRMNAMGRKARVRAVECFSDTAMERATDAVYRRLMK